MKSNMSFVGLVAHIHKSQLLGRLVQKDHLKSKNLDQKGNIAINFELSTCLCPEESPS